MKSAIIVHGTTDKEEYYSDKYPSQSNSHWIPWLQKQLLIKGYDCQTPEMPNPIEFKYVYSEWVKVFERFPINKDSILIGHSTGTGFLLRYLSENTLTIKGLLLVSPYLDPYKMESDEVFEFEFDLNLLSRANYIHALYSKDDSKSVLKSTEILKEVYPELNIIEYENMGHFTMSSMGTDKFPDLLELIE